MENYNEILRYMGYAGEIDGQMEELISSCLQKLAAVSDPRHVTARLPCAVEESVVCIDTLRIESAKLAAHLLGCGEVYVFAATLGAGVDRLIAQRAKVDSAEALCVQACAAACIEDYCDAVEQEILADARGCGLCLRPRFSPGYGDFDIACQTDILRVLQAPKKIGVSETSAHILTPLKSVTALVGAGVETAVRAETSARARDKCVSCGKAECPFRKGKISAEIFSTGSAKSAGG